MSRLKRLVAALAAVLALAGCQLDPGTLCAGEPVQRVQLHAEWEWTAAPGLRVWSVPPGTRVDLIMNADWLFNSNFSAAQRCHQYGGTFRYFPSTKQDICEGINQIP